MSGDTTKKPSLHLGLSTTTSVSSLVDMVRAHDERTPLAGRDDIEAGPAHYGTTPFPRSGAASYAGESRSSGPAALRSKLISHAGTQASQESQLISKRNSKFARRVRYYIPSTAWIPDYSLSLYVCLFQLGALWVDWTLVLEATFLLAYQSRPC